MLHHIGYEKVSSKHKIGTLVRVQRFGDRSNQGRYDDSGFNAIRLACSGGEVLKSAEGHLGNWNKWIFSTRNTSIDTVFIRSQRPCGDCDDTATHGIRFRESTHINPRTFEPYNGYWKQYHPEYTEYRFRGYWATARCIEGKVITGFRTQVEPDQGRGDDTGLNRMQFKCDYGD